MKKIFFLVCAFTLLFTSCGKKDKVSKQEEGNSSVENSNSANNIDGLVIPVFDGTAKPKQKIKFNVFVNDFGVNFSTDENLAEKAKKRVLSGFETNPVRQEINIVDKIDDSTDVIVFGTVAKQTMTKIDSQDVIIAYTMNVVSSQAKSGKIIHSVSQTSDRSLEKAVSELTLFNGDCYFERAKKYAELGQAEDAINDCNRALELGANKEDVLKTRAYAYLVAKNTSAAYKDLQNANCLNQKDLQSVYLTGLYYRVSKNYGKAIDVLKNAIPSGIIPVAVVAQNEVIVDLSEEVNNTSVENNDDKVAEDDSRIAVNSESASSSSEEIESEKTMEEVVTQETVGIDENKSEFMYLIKILEELAKTYLESKDYVSAENTVLLLQEKDLTNQCALYVLANSSLEQENWKKAESVLANVNENNSPLFYERAFARYKQGLYEAAINDLQLLTQGKKSSLETNNLVAKIYYEIGKADYAMPYLNAAISNVPSTEIFFLRGMANVALNQNEEALSDFNSAIELDKNYVEAFFQRGSLYLNLHQYESALSDLEKSIALGMKSAENYFYIGEANIYLKEYTHAVENLNLAVQMEGENAKVLEALGMANYALKQFKSAEDAFSKRLSIRHDNPFVYLFRAVSLHQQGKFTLAVEDYEQAIKLLPDTKENKEWISLCEKGSKDCKKEKSDSLEKVVDIFKYPLDYQSY